MISIDDLFEMGVRYQNQNNFTMAIQMYNEVLALDPKYAMVHINMAKVLASQGNIQGEYEALKNFTKCPLTMVTFEMIPQIKQRLEQIEKSKQPQPVPVK